MKKIIPAFLIIFLLSSCNGWIIQPLPGNPPTPFLPFTPTPSIFTSTPVIIGVTSVTSTPVVISLTPTITYTPFPTFTNAPTLTASSTPTATPTVHATLTNDPFGKPSISIKVLGCNTSIDVTYQVTIKLTVDSTFKKETPIQVEVATDQGAFPREGLASCTDLGLFAPKPDGLNTPVPVTP